jgi:GAF domain-containing protein/signal transduction histidine kinase
MAQTTEETSNLSTTQLLQRHVRELSTLHEIARAMTSVLDLGSVLNRIVEAAVYLTNAEEGFLLLVNEDTGDLTLRAGKGLGEKAARGMSIKVTDSIAGQVVKTGRPVRMGGFRHDEEYKVKTGYLVKSLVNVPIKSSGRVIGVLSVDHSVASMRSFTNHDVALLSSLADYAAIAIQNAHLFAEASARADELAKALEEQTGIAPTIPPPEQDRHALEQFAQGLRAQREDVLHSIESTRNLANDLRIQAQTAEDVVRRLGLWDEGVLNLLPQLEWLTQTELPRTAEAPSPPPETSPLHERRKASTSAVSDDRLLEHLVEGMLLCDANGIIRQANKAAVQILDKPVAELIETNLQTVINNPRWERMVGSLRLALAMASEEQQSAPPVPETTLFINEHTIHAKLVSIHENQTEAASIIAVFHDISAETEGWRARDEALAALSQRLRGPMTAVASYSDLLLGETVGTVDPAHQRYLQRIQQGIERLEAVLRELGEELTSSGRRISPALSGPTEQIINQAVDAAQKVLSLDGVNIVRHIGHNLPPVQVDAECISRIVVDLLTTTGKHTSIGSSVTISTQLQAENEKPGHLIVFVQSEDATTEDITALEEDESIRAALSLVEDEGGRIWMERKPNGSDLICFLLPVAEPQLTDQQS